MTEFRPNTMPTYPNHAPAKRRPKWIAPTVFAAGGLIVGSLFTGLIVNANNQARIDHCVGALDSSGEAMYAAGDAIAAAGSFDIAGLEDASDRIASLNDAAFNEDVSECRGAGA
jgi:hypothetical protein